jgi:Flp pilus assembly pilin Flp
MYKPYRDYYLILVFLNRSLYMLGEVPEMKKAIIRNFIRRENGQGVVEYFSILAFVSLLVALCFALGQGTFSEALFQSFSSMVSQFNRLIDPPPP